MVYDVRLYSQTSQHHHTKTVFILARTAKWTLKLSLKSGKEKKMGKREKE